MKLLGVIRKAVYTAVALVCWVFTFGGAVRKRRVVVLCYHGVRDSQRSAFERQMRALRGRCVSSHELPQSRPGRGVPKVLLTFDDAFANLIDNAMPALRSNNLPAAIFAVSDNLGAPPRWSMPDDHPERSERTMTAEELADVANVSGITIGSHTHTHPRLSDIPRELLVRELEESRAQLEAIIHKPVRELALPHGAWSPAVIDAARAGGYEKIYTLEHDLEPSGLGPNMIGRFSMSPDVSLLQFRLTIDGAYCWLGAFRRMVNRHRRRSAATPLNLKEAAA